MRITGTTSSGKFIQIDANHGDTIKDVKIKLNKINKIPIGQMILKLNDQSLSNDKKIEYYGLDRNFFAVSRKKPQTISCCCFKKTVTV